MNRTAITIATVATLSFSATALAAGNDASTGAGDPEKAETAHQAEVLDESSEPAITQADFDELDRNQDGKLDEDELSAYGSTAAGQAGGDAESGEKMLDRLDQDGDGAISQEELQQEASPSEEGSGATGAGSSGGATQ